MTQSGKEQISMQDDGVVCTRYWHRLEDDRIQCDLCPRECKLHEGQRGLEIKPEGV